MLKRLLRVFLFPIVVLTCLVGWVLYVLGEIDE